MKLNLHVLDLTLEDRVACRRQYRTLRCAIYAPLSSPHARDGMLQGYFGMSRDEARDFLWAFYSEVSWLAYLGEK